MAGRIVIVIGALVLGLIVGLGLFVFLESFVVSRQCTGACGGPPIVNRSPAYYSPAPTP